MIAASAAAITYARRSWSAGAKRHRALRGLGVSSRECEPDRNAVRIRVSLAWGRRIYPSAAARNVEPENFRARGWRRTGRARRCGTGAEAVALAAADTVGAAAPRKIAMVTVTPSDDLGAPVCVQNSHWGRRDERRRSGVRRAAEENGCSKSNLACPHEGPSLAPTHARNANGGGMFRRTRAARALTFWGDARG